MFGVMDLKTGKCWRNNEHQNITVGTYRHRFPKESHVAVPKDYINWWKSGHKCEHEGCFEDGSVEGRIPEGGEYFKRHKDSVILLEHLCPDHAFKRGYCTLCGDFWGGIESFDFNNPQQLCENCLDQIKTELDEYETEEAEYYGEYY